MRSGIREARRQLVQAGLGQRWPTTVMAEVMGIKCESLKRCTDRLDGQRRVGKKKLRRPLAIPVRVRLEIRNCHIGHYKQWGPSTLAHWCRREGLRDYTPRQRSQVSLRISGTAILRKTKTSTACPQDP